MRGYILARKDWTIEYINSLDLMTLHFVAHWLTKKDQDTWDTLGRILGTHWSQEQLKDLHTSKKVNPDKFMIPLAYFIQPNLKEMLQPSVSVGDRVIEGDVQNLMDIPKEEFIAKMQSGWVSKK